MAEKCVFLVECEIDGPNPILEANTEKTGINTCCLKGLKVYRVDMVIKGQNDAEQEYTKPTEQAG